MSTLTTQQLKKTYSTGLIFILISLCFYCVPFFTDINEDAYFPLFAFNYLLTIAYFIVLLVTKRLRRASGAINSIFLWLILFLISAYSLNRTIPVFELSVDWLSIALVVSCVSLALFGVFDKLGKGLQYMLMFVVGIAATIFLYLAIYLFQLYPISAILSLGFGISVHSFVPLLILIFMSKKLWRLTRESVTYFYPFIAGVVATFAVAIVFTIAWSGINKEVKTYFQRSLVADNADLPGWVHIAENLEKGPLIEKYLKSELVYSVPSNNMSWGWPNRSFDEVRKHDPLIMFAYLFSKPPAINRKDRIKILESMYDSRHKTQERLWSGEDLITQGVITNVRIWPKTRIAYTEKTITVASTEEKRRTWQGRYEGIYTFYLPEGGVVTSLSLWIEGKEEKGILTSKSKADSAYKTIVGVESRDPSVVHWQEGNTVSVRVFPIMSGENRVFKIGVTAPLACVGDELVYENITFRGPDANDALETIQVLWESMPEGFTMPENYEQNATNRFRKEGKYNSNFELRFKKSQLAENAFSFDGYTYNIVPDDRVYEQKELSKIYLDLNKSWTEEELRKVLKNAGSKKVYVYDQDMIEVTEQTAQKLLHRLSTRNFTLFPFYELPESDNVLVVTKSSPTTPNIKDLKGSTFLEKLEHRLSKGGRVNLYCLGNDVSPYLKTLKEHRAFNYDYGDVDHFTELLTANKFIKNIESDSVVVVDNAAARLVRTKGDSSSNGPDHLMRLFAYNHIMQQLGTKAFTKQDKDTSLVKEAEQAYIVSPVSSLVVLESQKDYDRFDIKKSKNSLDNATIKSDGAVPEPHEWALIIIAVLAMLWYLYGNRLKLAK